eukprot:6787622-Prymnesium_polylepis.1
MFVQGLGRRAPSDDGAETVVCMRGGCVVRVADARGHGWWGNRSGAGRWLGQRGNGWGSGH